MKDKQIVFPAAEQAEFVDAERPSESLGATEVEGRTLYSLISNGTEQNVYLGNYERQGLTWGRFPFVPGYAATMDITAVGKDVTDLQAGDRCFCMGLHRTFQRFPREAVLKLPEGCDPRSAPFARLMNVTMSTLTTTTARPPAPVLVTGLGPIGLMGALIFQRCGYQVTGIDPVDTRRDAASSAGVRDVRATVPLDDKKLAGFCALVLECSAHEQAVLDALDMLEVRGEMVLVGVPMVRKTEIYAQELTNKIFRKVAVMRSGSEWEVPKYPTAYRKNCIYGNMTAALKWLTEGSIRVDGIYELRTPEDPQAIYQDVIHQRTAKPCTVLDWTSG